MGGNLEGVYSFDAAASAAYRGAGFGDMVRRVLVKSYRTARRIVVGAVGATVLAIGLALLVLPGPAFVVIPVGLAILGAEFAFARRWLRKLKQGANGVLQRVGGGGGPGPPKTLTLLLVLLLPLGLGAACEADSAGEHCLKMQSAISARATSPKPFPRSS